MDASGPWPEVIFYYLIGMGITVRLEISYRPGEFSEFLGERVTSPSNPPNPSREMVIYLS
jgi:hypothetical protein